ncbi:MAG: polysaccharide biosynthesis protein [Bacteroidaceae bacterium]|nr:polysaccharide biosynthesis protein [Bacteroidaceae bacterium]
MRSITKYVSEYLSTKVIFALDIATSLVSSAITLLVLNFLSDTNYYSGAFALWWIGGTALFNALSMFMFKTSNVVVRHATLSDVRRYAMSILCANILLGVLIGTVCTMNKSVLFTIISNLMLTMALVMAIRFIMIDMYGYYRSKVNDLAHKPRILVYGTSDKSVAAISRFSNSNHYHLVGFISNNCNDRGHKLAGCPVYTYRTEADFKAIADRLFLHAVLFATDADVRSEEESLVKYCTDSNIKTLIIPSVNEVIDGKIMKGSMRQVRIEDLLNRPEIRISIDEIRQNFQGKTVMVTGAAGSIGSELCRQLAVLGVGKLVLFDNAETPMHNLRLELQARFPELDFSPIIGSVRHHDRLDYAFRNWKPQVVFHAAAYKHVPLMEENPCEAVFANVHGSRMVADKCVEYGTEMMVMISTDKAVNPTNIMGCSKRLAEIYVQSLGLALAKGEIKGRTRFVTTRFGNVLGSNGSVIPRFRQQIESGGPVTVTHPDITRFFMTIPEACRLVMEAATMSTGNQIFVFDMGKAVKIADLAKRMIELAGFKEGRDIQIEYTGLRPGEKLYEEVLADTENTEPTRHDRIRIAKVREYDYHEAVQVIDQLTKLSKAVNIMEMVRLMKRTVPEFKSRNSRFEALDHENENPETNENKNKN